MSGAPLLDLSLLGVANSAVNMVLGNQIAQQNAYTQHHALQSGLSSGLSQMDAISQLNRLSMHPGLALHNPGSYRRAPSAPLTEEEQRFVTRVKSLMAILEAQLAEEDDRP